MPASIFNGTAVKILKDILRFKDGTEISSSDVADLVSNAGTSTDNAIPKFDSTTGKIIQNSGVILDDSNNITGVNDLTTVGNVIVGGDLTVNGTTTTINTATLDVEDQNITVNINGNDVSSEGAGLTINRTGTDGSIVYEDALTSKFKIGALGSEVEAADISSSQTLTNKTIDADSNTISNIDNADIKVGAAIDATKIHDGSVDNTEFGYLNGVTSSIQTQLDDKIEGPASSTSNALVRFNGTTGKLAQDTVNLTSSNGASIQGGDGSTLTATYGFQSESNTGMYKSALNTLAFITNGTERLSVDGSGVVTVNALTANRALTTNGASQLTPSTVTDTELGYLSGTTSSIQTQIDNHLADTSTHGITSNIVGESEVQTLTNKTIDADSNTISNIDNDEIKALAGIDATKIHDGSVDNTEFGYLNGVTSSIQTQIDGKLDDVLTTNGDLLYENSGEQRLGIGTNGQILTVSGGLPTWAAPSAGASGNINYIKNGAFHLNQPQYNASGTTQYGLNGTTVDLSDSYEGFSAGTYVAEAKHVASSTNFTRLLMTAEIQDAMRFDITTADATLAATDVLALTHKIPGYDYQILDSAGNYTLSFTYYTNKAGTYTVALRNGALDTYYLHEFVAVANTEARVSFTIPRPTIGTFNFNNTVGLHIHWVLAAGASRQSSTLDTWTSAATIVASTNQVNFADNTANFFEITAIKLEPGSSSSNFTYYGGSKEADTLANMKYYYKTYDEDVSPGTTSSLGNQGMSFNMDGLPASGRLISDTKAYTVKMDTTPSITIYDPQVANNSGAVRMINSAPAPTLQIRESQLYAQASEASSFTTGWFFADFIADSRL